MSRWLAVVVALGAVFLMASVSWSAEGIKIEGVIANWKEVKDRVPASAYFQLVRFRDKMKGTTDPEGFAAFESKLPKIKVRDDGSFKLSLKELPEGKYFIALQRAVPKEIYGDAVPSAIPLLITEKQEALMIQVPGTFPVNLGRVYVGVRAPKEPSPPPAPDKKAPAPEKAPQAPEKESPAPEKE